MKELSKILIVRTPDAVNPAIMRDEAFVSLHEVRTVLSAMKKKVFDNARKEGAGEEEKERAIGAIDAIERIGLALGKIK